MYQDIVWQPLVPHHQVANKKKVLLNSSQRGGVAGGVHGELSGGGGEGGREWQSQSGSDQSCFWCLAMAGPLTYTGFFLVNLVLLVRGNFWEEAGHVLAQLSSSLKVDFTSVKFPAIGIFLYLNQVNDT